jgi:hypothetical protein
VPYLPLPNFNHDSGPRRIQSGPDHEGYVVLYSGVESTGADDGFAVLGAPLSGTLALGAWDYDSNWRYVPSTLPSQSGSLDPTPYNVSGALDTYDATRIYTRDNVAGAQAASAIGPETGKVNPRGGALQPRADVTRPETYMYYGGAAPDNQDYSPYNTPDANSAAEGKTGGGVTHRSYESTLLTNVLGSQGTSDRSQWRYHQPVYCKTYTETRRSETPGLMSTPLRYVYRGSASSYNYNYGSELLANKGGFELLPYDDQTFGCPFPVGCPTTNGDPLVPIVGDTLSAVVYCDFNQIEWFNSDGQSIGFGLTYTLKEFDVGYKIYYTVTYSDGSKDSSFISCLSSVVYTSLLKKWYFLAYNPLAGSWQYPPIAIQPNGDMIVARVKSLDPQLQYHPILHRVDNNLNSIKWAYQYIITSPLYNRRANFFGRSSYVLDEGESYVEFFYWEWTFDATKTLNLGWPVRIYKFRVNKSDGSLLDLKAVDYNPGTALNNANQFGINKVLSKDGSYYLSGNFPRNNSIYGPGILKMDSDLNILWLKYIQALIYRGGTACQASIQSIDINMCAIVGNTLIGSGVRANFIEFEPPFFALDLNTGATLKQFRGKFPSPPFPDPGDPSNPYIASTVSVDEDGNVYSFGEFSGSGSGLFGPVLIVKDTPDDTTVWAFNIKGALTNYGVSQFFAGQDSSIFAYDKFLLIGVSPRSSQSEYILFIINKTTGAIEKALGIKTANGDSISSDGISIQKAPQPNGIVIQSPAGYVFRLDISNLPSGTYTSTDTVTPYTFTPITPSQVSQTMYRSTLCSPSAGGFVNPSGSLSLTSASVSATPSGVSGFGPSGASRFGFFAIQS